MVASCVAVLLHADVVLLATIDGVSSSSDSGGSWVHANHTLSGSDSFFGFDASAFDPLTFGFSSLGFFPCDFQVLGAWPALLPPLPSSPPSYGLSSHSYCRHMGI